MRLAISGVQGSGKTTIVNYLKKMPQFQYFNFKTNIVRDLAAKGFKINEVGTDETQLAVCNAHLENLKLNNLVTDRCLLDCLAYSSNLYKNNKINLETLDYVYNHAKNNISKYDFIFLLVTEFDIEEDNIRNTDITYVNNINYEFLKLKEMFKNVVRLTGTVDERVSQILEITKLN